MNTHSGCSRLKSTRRTIVLTMLAGVLSFAVTLQAQNNSAQNPNAFHASFGRSVIEADTLRAHEPVHFSPPTPVYTRVASAGLIINATYNANVDAATQNTINNIINFYESSITTPITVNIEFHSMASGLGS